MDSPEQDIERLLLEYVHRAGYHPVKPRVIAKKLGIGEDDRRSLKQAIKRLVKQGRLTWGPRHLVEPGEIKPPPVTPISHPSSELAGGDGDEQESPRTKVASSEDALPHIASKNPEVASKKLKRREQRDNAARPRTIKGVFHKASAGYGFVRPTGTPASAGRGADIYIPLRKTRDAADGDLVLVFPRRKRNSRDDRLSGEIVEILERGTNQFVGVYHEEVGVGYVQVDGGVFAHPIQVGDAGAKNVRPGDKVVIELVRYPSHFFEGEGVVVEVLGPRGAPGVDTLTVIREFNLPDRFPEEVLEAAREQARRFDESLEGRFDLTAETVITIDPVDARDFDDAISLERTENGHWRLGVHIADVAHFTPFGSEQDIEARQRATSVYLPDRVLPMLPEIISNNLASLQPDRVRYTKSVFIDFSPEGVKTGAEFHNAAIRSKRRFAYEEVDDYLANRESWRSKLKPEVFELLGRMHELAMLLRRRRLEAGAIELTLPEVSIDLDRQGKVCGAHVVENTVSHQIIEEFMLACNETVAEKLAEKGLAFLRRVHSPPDPRKLLALTQFVRELGIPCESLESRFEIKRVVAEVEQRPERQAVNYAVLRSMQKAVYSPEEEGHYALASKCYCHFTSPIRRYPDLTVHRLLDSLIRGKRPASDFDQLVLLGDHCSEREQRAEAAERELIKVKLLHYLSERIGMTMEAVIVKVDEWGMLAQGVDLPAEGYIRIDALADDHYHYEAATHSLTGRKAGNSFRLGDVIQVEVAHVDIDRRELDFRVVGRKSRKRPAGSRPTGTAADRRRERSRYRGVDGGVGERKPGGRRKRGK